MYEHCKLGRVYIEPQRPRRPRAASIAEATAIENAMTGAAQVYRYTKLSGITTEAMQ